MSFLALLALLVLQALAGRRPASPACPPRSEFARAPRNTRHFGATARLTVAKHQVRDWAESRLAGTNEAGRPGIRRIAAHAALSGAGLFCNDLNEECDWNSLGYVDDVRVSRTG